MGGDGSLIAARSNSSSPCEEFWSVNSWLALGGVELMDDCTLEFETARLEEDGGEGVTWVVAGGICAGGVGCCLTIGKRGVCCTVVGEWRGRVV